MSESRFITVGGWSFIAFAALYLGMQACLRIFFNYPAVLHGPDSSVLPLLLDGGVPFAICLTIFALLPLILLPGSVGVYYALREENESLMRVGLLFAVVAVVAMIISLMRWPGFNWSIALTYADPNATEAERGMLSAILFAANTYFGTYLGGFLASISAGIWFLIVSLTMLKSRYFPKWMGWLGVAAGVYLIISIFESFDFLSGIAETILHSLSPIDSIWILVLGIGLLLHEKAT